MSGNTRQSTIINCAVGPKATCFCVFDARRGVPGPYQFVYVGDRASFYFWHDSGRPECARSSSFMVTWLGESTQTSSDEAVSAGWHPTHTPGDRITLRHQLFGNRLISQGTEHDWAPHSPDLNPLDFWLRGACKGFLYGNRPTIPDELDEAQEKLRTKKA